MSYVELLEGSTSPPDVKIRRPSFVREEDPTAELEGLHTGFPGGSSSTGNFQPKTQGRWSSRPEDRLGLSNDTSSLWASLMEAPTRDIAPTQRANENRLLLLDTVSTDPHGYLVTIANNDALPKTDVFADWPEQQTSDPFIDYILQLVGRQKTSDLLAGYEEYERADWDGYGAEPISAETIDAARSFLQRVPRTLGQPEISPGSDGTIGLEWVRDTGPFRKLFIDIGPGKIWHAYWRLADGRTDKLRSQKLDDTTRKVFRQIVFKLRA